MTEARVSQTDRSVLMELWPLGARIGFLSIATDELSRKTEMVASDASYRGTEQQVNALLDIARQFRALAGEMEALR